MQAIAEREQDRIKQARELTAEAARSGVALARQIHDTPLPWFITTPYKVLCMIL